MDFPILVRWHLYNETDPCLTQSISWLLIAWQCCCNKLIMSMPLPQSLSYFAQSTASMLLCSVQNFYLIRSTRRELLAIVDLWDLSFWWMLFSVTISRLVLSLDSFTVYLHSPNGRYLPAVTVLQEHCKWPLKNGGNSHWSLEPMMHQMWGVPQCVYRSSNHRSDKTVNNMNPGYSSLAATALKLQKNTHALHISARVWGRRWSPQTSEQKGSMLKPQ